MARIAVLGAGNWGTALSIHMCRRGHQTTMWTRTPAHGEAMARERVNRRYLPEVDLPDDLEITSDLGLAASGADLIVCAIPSHAMGEALSLLSTNLSARERPQFLIASKGVEVDSLETMADVARRCLGSEHHDRVVVLGGPSFAVEVAEAKPCAVVVAASDLAVAKSVQRQLSGHGLRAYASDDVVGVELGGAFKNVIALATGINDGAGLGLNSRAALITRGLAEISRLAIAMGARRSTLSGLAGLGDLVLTCTGSLSRNRSVGIALGQGRSIAEILGSMNMVAEGVKNTLSAQRMAKREGIEMPIVDTMHEILYRGRSIAWAVESLMQRSLRAEVD